MNVSLWRAALRSIRRVPVWIYFALLTVGVIFAGNAIYQRDTSLDAAKAYAQATNEMLRSPIAGITYELTVYQWQQLPVSSNGPLTTADSFSFEVAPQGSDCSKGQIRRVEIEFLSPAFSVEPENRIGHNMTALQQNYCIASRKPLLINYHWDVLARQAGHHVVALRIIGLDAKGKEVSVHPLEIPVVVSDNPFTLVGLIGSLGAIGGFIGIFLSLLPIVIGGHRDADA
jgi:hypothetical protein